VPAITGHRPRHCQSPDPTIDHPTSKEERGMGPGVLKRDGAAVVTGGAAGPPNGNGGLRGAEE